MLLQTQSNSKPRLENDTLGDTMLKQLYYQVMNIEITESEFEQQCIDVVQAGGGSQPKKDQIIAAIRGCKTRIARLKKAQDFIMAGMGLGV